MNLPKEVREIYERCNKQFGASWDDGLVLVYGDQIYSTGALHPCLKAHEDVHIKQQRVRGPEPWWNDYFADPEFRKSQEVEAYRVQVRWLRENLNREDRRPWEKHIMKSMISMYGGIFTEEETKDLIYEKVS